MRRYFAVTLLTIMIVASGCGGDDDDDDDATKTAEAASTSAATPAATATNNPNHIPVIFIPGVAGSRLKRGADSLWANVNKQVFSLNDDHLRALSLAANGIDPDPSVEASPTVEIDGAVGLEEVTVDGWPLKTLHYYDTTLQYFTDHGYRENVDFFVFAFDWRLDVEVEASRLAGEIALRAGPDGKVNIVAHSMGGLVALKALDDARTTGKVDKFVTIATPVLGATKALGVLEYRALCFTEYLPKTQYCVTNQRTAQESARNFPGLYQLLPSRDFQTAVRSPLQVQGVDASYEQWANIVGLHRNPGLLAAAEAFHAGLNPRPNGVHQLRIVGTGKDTPTWIEEFEVQDCLFLGVGCETKIKHKVHEDKIGDGTVPLGSADLSDGVQTITFTGIGHMEMASDPNVLGEVMAFLEGRTMASVAALVSMPLRAARAEQPQLVDGVSITLLGAIWGQATDGTGNTTGPLAAGDVAADAYYVGIPGSSFERVGDTQQFFFEDDGAYTLDFETPPPGSDEYTYLAELAGAGENGARPEDVLLTNVVLVEVERYEDGAVADRQVYHVAATPTGQLRVALNTDSNDLDVRVTSDPGGDGDYEDEPEARDDYAPLLGGQAEATATATETPPLQSACIQFESPEPGTQYRVGQGLAESGVRVDFEPFTWSNGQQTKDGIATIDAHERAGGSGQDLGLNNINAAFDFTGKIVSISLLAGAYGGNLNLTVNGELANIGDLAELSGNTLGSALVTVERGRDDGLYSVTISGPVRSFSIGGQEFWIDEVCATLS